MTSPLHDDAKSRLIFALDVPTAQEAKELVAQLYDHVGYFKVGPELFLAAGPSLFDWLPARQVMLDMKLHDIPETVERTFRQIVRMGVAYATLHVQQRETLQRVSKLTAHTGTRPLGITVLTSVQETDLIGLMQPSDVDPTYFNVAERVEHLAVFAFAAGLAGFVCSPKEVASLRVLLPTATLIVPGIRPAGAALGDQQRTGTPGQAIRDGASAIVVGRPIRDAADPAEAAAAIVAEVRAALAEPAAQSEAQSAIRSS